MPVCYLHVGSHKTGTSALQTFLARNRKVFAQHHILVPAAGTSATGSHLPLVRALLGLPGRDGEGALRQLTSEISECPGHHIVVSAEFLETVFQRQAGEDPILRFFLDAGYEVRLILYVRNTPQWVNARYSQRVKMFRYNGDFPGMVQQLLAKQNAGLRRWSDFVRNNRCKLSARPYTGAIQSGGLIPDFMNILGFEWAAVSGQFVLPERINESVGPSVVAAARRIMSALPGGARALNNQQSGKCGRILLQHVRALGLEEEKFSGLDTAGARRLEGHFRDSNGAFARAFWQASWDDVFSADTRAEFVINDLAQKPITSEERDRVERLYESAWPAIQRAITGKTPDGFRRPRSGRQKASGGEAL